MMLRSLRTRLVMGVVAAAIMFFAVAGLALYTLVRNALYSEFDAVLGSKARILSIMVVEGDDDDNKPVYKLVYERAHFPEYERRRDAEYFQIWRANGKTLQRSPSLERYALPEVEGSVDHPVAGSMTLPDGRQGRYAGIRFTPRREDGEKLPYDRMKEMVLVVAQSTDLMEQRLARFRWIIGSVVLGGMAAVSLALFGVVAALLRPLESLARRIARLDADDLSARFGGEGLPTELRPIASRLDELLRRLEAAFAREKSFTSDIAHELRTPLSGLRTTIDVALRQDRDGPEYRRAFAECGAMAERLQALVDNLLSLAQLEGGRIHLEREPVQLDWLIREVWRPYATSATDRKASVTMDLGPVVMVDSDAVKLRIVLGNLFDNAVSYTDRGGSIALRLRSVSGRAELEIANSGCELDPKDAHRIFDRFWRGDQSRTGAHCGLGLALSRRLVHLLDGALRPSVVDGRFHMVLDLPLAALPQDDEVA